MIIRITDGESTSTLAAGPARVVGQARGPSGFSMSGRTSVQQRSFLRAAASSNVDRGNLQTQLQFSSHYEFASVAAASLFAATHVATVMRSHTVELVLYDGTMVVVSDAVLLDPQLRWTGRSVDVAYSIVGGAQAVVAAPEAAYDADGEEMVEADGEPMVFQAG